MLSISAASGLVGVDTGELVVQPVRRRSIAMHAAAASVVMTGDHQFRIPSLTGDGAAAWTAEGEELANTDSQFGELVVTPCKVGRVVVISRELAEDSSPNAQAAVGESLASSLATAVDSAFFAASTAHGPAGLAGAGVPSIAVDELRDFDVLALAIAACETAGGTVSSIVTSPQVAYQLGTLKRATGSHEPLLGPDTTAAGRRQIMGVPLLVSPGCAPSDVWVLDASRVVTVVRDDVQVDVDRSVFFTSDRIAVRATMRVGFAFPHPAALSRITIGG